MQSRIWTFITLLANSNTSAHETSSWQELILSSMFGGVIPWFRKFDGLSGQQIDSTSSVADSTSSTSTSASITFTTVKPRVRYITGKRKVLRTTTTTTTSTTPAATPTDSVVVVSYYNESTEDTRLKLLQNNIHDGIPVNVDDTAEALLSRYCPVGCSAWSDGCNECHCDWEGRILSCSKRFCTSRTKPTCLDSLEVTRQPPPSTTPVSEETPRNAKRWLPRNFPPCPRGCRVFSPDLCNECYCNEEGKTVWCSRGECATAIESNTEQLQQQSPVCYEYSEVRETTTTTTTTTSTSAAPVVVVRPDIPPPPLYTSPNSSTCEDAGTFCKLKKCEEELRKVLDHMSPSKSNVLVVVKKDGHHSSSLFNDYFHERTVSNMNSPREPLEEVLFSAAPTDIGEQQQYNCSGRCDVWLNANGDLCMCSEMHQVSCRQIYSRTSRDVCLHHSDSPLYSPKELTWENAGSLNNNDQSSWSSSVYPHHQYINAGAPNSLDISIKIAS